MASKAAEGKQLFEAGEKCLKTSVFKWAPDWEGAVGNFEKAGNCFKLAKEHERCAESFIRAAEAREKTNELYHSAKNLELAAQAYKEAKKFGDAVSLCRRACLLYRRNGTADAAATACEKGAVAAEQGGDLEGALELYTDLLSLWEDENKTHMMKQPIQKTIQIAARLNKFDRLLEALDLQAKIYQQSNLTGQLHLNVLSRLVVKVKQGDVVSAEKLFTEAVSSVNGFATSTEGAVAEEFLGAADKRDLEAMAVCVSKQTFTFLENELLKMARGLVPAEYLKKAKAPASGSSFGAAASSAFPASSGPREKEGGSLEDAMSAVHIRPAAAAAAASSSPSAAAAATSASPAVAAAAAAPPAAGFAEHGHEEGDLC